MSSMNPKRSDNGPALIAAPIAKILPRSDQELTVDRVAGVVADKVCLVHDPIH